MKTQKELAGVSSKLLLSKSYSMLERNKYLKISTWISIKAGTVEQYLTQWKVESKRAYNSTQYNRKGLPP